MSSVRYACITFCKQLLEAVLVFSLLHVVTKLFFYKVFFGSLIVHGYLKDRKFLRSNVFVQFIFVMEVSKNVNFAELKIASMSVLWMIDLFKNNTYFIFLIFQNFDSTKLAKHKNKFCKEMCPLVSRHISKWMFIIGRPCL